MRLGLKELQQVRDEALRMGLNHHSKKRTHLARACYDLAYQADVVIAMTTVGAAQEAQRDANRNQHGGQANGQTQEPQT